MVGVGVLGAGLFVGVGVGPDWSTIIGLLFWQALTPPGPMTASCIVYEPGVSVLQSTLDTILEGTYVPLTGPATVSQ